MARNIFRGFNCCHHFGYIEKDVYITPNRATVRTGQSLYLSVAGVPPGCDGSCFSWKLVRGAGRLPFPNGFTVIYYAPTDAPECTGFTVIDLICGGKVRDHAFISVTSAPTDKWAYTLYPKVWHLEPYMPKPRWWGEDKPEPPPLQPPPKYISYDSTIHFPWGWRPGSDLPQGAKAQRTIMIPKDWQPGMMPPFGVKIAPGTVFPPGWKPGDPWPQGMEENTYELFPQDYECWPPSQRNFCVFVPKHYNCADEFVTEDVPNKKMTNVYWDKPANYWRLQIDHAALEPPFHTSLKNHWDPLLVDYPRLWDRRTPEMIAAHCCPLKLLIYNLEQKQQRSLEAWLKAGGG